MTRDQFNEWKADLFLRFPAIKQWVVSSGDDSSVRRFLEKWFVALEDRELVDCLAVNDALSRGEYEGVGKFASDWQLLPGRVRQLAGAWAWERCDRERQKLQAEQGLDGPRHRCSRCMDSGYIQVASPKAVKAATDGMPYRPEKMGQPCVARCAYCPKGRPHIPTPATAQPNTPTEQCLWCPVFNPEYHFEVPWDHMGQEQTYKRLLAWVAERKTQTAIDEQLAPKQKLRELEV